MKQAMKGKEWEFGMKIHIGVDAGFGSMTAVERARAGLHDISVENKLLRKDGRIAYGNSGYLGLNKREEFTHDLELVGIEFRLIRHPVQACKKYANGRVREKVIERQKSSIRVKVEFPFRFMKVRCGYRKTVYKGIVKNLNRACIRTAKSKLGDV